MIDSESPNTGSQTHTPGVRSPRDITGSLQPQQDSGGPLVIDPEAHNGSQPSLTRLGNDRAILQTEPANADPGYSESKMREEIHCHLTNIISDRDSLQTQLNYTKSTVRELHAENQELHRLLKAAQDALRSCDDKKPTQIHPRNLDLSHDANWIGGTWLACAKETPMLAGAEEAWQGGKPQQALALLTSIIHEEGLKPSHRVNAGLLYSAILRSNNDLQGALHRAEESLSIAMRTEKYQLIGKAQFHRGLCSLYLNQFAKARWSFVLGSHTEGHAAIIQDYSEMAKQKLSSVGAGEPGVSFTL